MLHRMLHGSKLYLNYLSNTIKWKGTKNGNVFFKRSYTNLKTSCLTEKISVDAA